MNNLIKVNKNDFMSIVKCRSVFFSLGKRQTESQPQILTEALVSEDSHENYFIKNEDEKNPNSKIFLRGNDFNLSLSPLLDEANKKSKSLRLFKTSSEVVEHSTLQLKSSKVSKSTKEMVEKIFAFFDAPSQEKYADLNALKIKLIPDYFYINNPSLGDLKDLKEILNLKKVYLLNDVISAKYTEIDLNNSSIFIMYKVNYFENEVVLDLKIKLHFLDKHLDISSLEKTENGYILRGDKTFYTSESDLGKDVRTSLNNALKMWNKKINLKNEVDF